MSIKRREPKLPLEGFGYSTMPRQDKFELRRLTKDKEATVVCARCNQPTNGDRTCDTCSKVGVRELHPDEIDSARAAAIAAILADRKKGWRIA